MSDGKNFPEPKTNADRIALKAAELLDQDVWEDVTDFEVTVRGVRIGIHKDYPVKVPVSSSDADILKMERPSAAIAELVLDSFTRAMARERERRLMPRLEQIESEDWKRIVTDKARKAAWRELWRELRPVIAWCVVIVVGMGGAFGGIASCVAAEERAQAVRDNQVNEYGFRYGDLQHHLTYPKDCEWQRPGMGLADCKETFKHWEKRGSSWVDWEPAP